MAKADSPCHYVRKITGLEGKKVAVAQCPASCGELIQGWIQGSEKLISCPIGLYSTVEVRAGKPAENERPLTRAMVEKLLQVWGYPEHWSRTLRINVHSAIPVAKGMASSTADIAATALATARYFDLTLSEHELAALCVSLEPTDSTPFRQLTLFDPNQGDAQSLGTKQPLPDIIILESPHTLNTADYHQLDRQDALLASAPQLDLAWQKAQQACNTGSAALLGEAATLSAQASQYILPKPGFARVMNIVEKYSLYGVNVAHSGSVMGLLLDRERHDVDAVMAELQQGDGKILWPDIYLLPMVEGGVR
jgi:Protein involved in propanediol utilization, and related proteins (includes coumermycin biosynthetic protein), possible kinase